MFISHIGAMDSFARGLKIAAKIKEEGVMAKHVKVLVILTFLLENLLFGVPTRQDFICPSSYSGLTKASNTVS